MCSVLASLFQVSSLELSPDGQALACGARGEGKNFCLYV
jgi:hypothetical protein